MIKEIEEALRTSNDLLTEADEEQWHRPPYPVGDSPGVKSGSLSDTTSTIALDIKRLRLRAAVLKTERSIRELVEGVSQANAELQKALADFNGE